MPDSDAAQPLEPSPSPTSRWEDFVDIFYAPAEVFARRRDGSFWPPLLFVTLVMTVLYLGIAPLLEPIFDAEWARQAEGMTRANPELTAEQLEKGRSFAQTFGVVFVLLGLPISVFVAGLTLWLVGKLFDARQGVRSSIVIAAYAFFPRILEQVLAGVQGLLLDPSSLTSRYSVSLSLARFLDPDEVSAAVLALAGRVDVFAVWVAVLLAIGLRVAGRVPGPMAALAGAIMWVLGSLPDLAGPIFSGGG